MKMKKIHRLATVALMALLLATPADAVIKKVAQTGLQFLKIDMSARSAAMGSAFTMVGDDANAMFFNPAGISKFKSGIDVFATQTKWFADISYNAAGVLLGLGNAGTIGLNFITADYGDIIGTRVSSAAAGYEETGNLTVGAYTAGLVYSRQLSSKFYVGGQLRYAHQHLGASTLPTATEGETEDVENKVNGLAYEIGTMFYPGVINSFRLGMSVKNFSPQFKYQDEAFQLPLTLTLGAAVDVFEMLGGNENNSLLIAVDALHPRDYTERIHLGLEYTLMNILSLRAGYKFNYDIESFSAGAGIQYPIGGMKLKIDYAYSASILPVNFNRITLGVSF